MAPSRPTRRARDVVVRYAAAGRRELRAVAAERRVRRALDDADRCTGDPGDPVVSLTTFPARIGSVHLPLRSLLRQRRRPGRIDLVLSEQEFPDRVLPQEVRELEARGVRVVWTPDNLRSFKKLVPLLDQLETGVVVTVDDDVVYPVDWLEDLWTAHLREPATIWGTRGRQVVVHEGRLAPYGTWPFADAGTDSDHTLLTGMGGVLYPPRSLPAETGDMATAMRLCPRADDVWFKACAMAASTPVRQLPGGPLDLPTRWRGQRGGLTASNVHGGENDEQLRATLAHFGLLGRLGVVDE